MTRVLPPHEAAAFLARRLPRFNGRVEGSVDPNRFEVIREMPSFDMAVDSREDGDIDLDLLFITESGRRARPADVLAGWSERRALVPLMEGGYAPMPSAWLEEHGLVLKELIEARRNDGSVPRQNLLSVLDLASEQDAPVPPDLERLHAVLAGEDGVDELSLIHI